MRDSWRLAVGTWTIVRVQPPTRVDPAVAGKAMLLGPWLGMGLGFVAGIPALALIAVSATLNLPGFAAPLAYVVLLAVLTRTLHLDGLADTADALGSGKSGDAALAIMKRSDIGPFGVVTLVCVLLAQFVAVDALALSSTSVAMLVLAPALGRLVAAWNARQGVPAARPDGLGAAVIGSVNVTALIAESIVIFAIGATWFALHSATWWAGLLGWTATFVITLAVAPLVARRAVSRFGGLTGDVLGASVELATTVSLVVAAYALTAS
jgi:adenosylcobinamide-GDP ribazoletransferase